MLALLGLDRNISLHVGCWLTVCGAWSVPDWHTGTTADGDMVEVV